MGDIDWSKLYRATSTSNAPTPGYLFNDIIHDVSHAKPREIPAVALYLADCADGGHAHVKLKALFCIKALAYRVPPFCACMQEHLPSVREAAAFSGPPSTLFGDEPYRLVREAAEAALVALTGGEYYHEQYREMSQRIVGFGNYQPSDDTVLSDGSINVARDVTYMDMTLSAVGLVKDGVGAILGGVKEILASPFAPPRGLDGLGGDGDLDAEEEPEEGGAAGDLHGDPRGPASRDDEAAGEEEQEDESGACVDEDGGYRPSPGAYVPPTLPPAPAPEPGEEEQEREAQGERRAREEDVSWSPASSPGFLASHVAQDTGADDEDALFRLLGVPAYVGGSLGSVSVSRNGGQEEASPLSLFDEDLTAGASAWEELIALPEILTVSPVPAAAGAVIDSARAGACADAQGDRGGDAVDGGLAFDFVGDGDASTRASRSVDRGEGESGGPALRTLSGGANAVSGAALAGAAGGGPSDRGCLAFDRVGASAGRTMDRGDADIGNGPAGASFARSGMFEV